MSGGGLSGVGTAVNAAQRLRRSDAATSAATQLMESAQQMGVLNVELMARDLARIADADPQRADDLMAELKPQLSAADQETLAQELAAAGVKTVTSKVGKNEVTWKLDAEGYPVRAEGDLREVFSNATRSASETKAQGEAADRGQAGDVGGHIVGHRFVLDQERQEPVPAERPVQQQRLQKTRKRMGRLNRQRQEGSARRDRGLRRQRRAARQDGGLLQSGRSRHRQDREQEDGGLRQRSRPGLRPHAEERHAVS